MLTGKRKSLFVRTAAFILGASLSLQVPAFAASYTAKDGDTFYSLSQRYGITVNALMQANPNVKAANIYEGLKLNIPDSVKTASTGQAVTLLNANTSASASSKEITADASSLKELAESKIVQAWGKSFNYNKKIDVVASAYSSAADENGQWGAVDYFGNPLKLGTIAVDPSVIPMGTKVLVTGHSFNGLPKNAFVATASDQGGAIKGNRIDIFVPGSKSEVNQFGLQDVTLYILQ
ncbi:3D domain-containing protein [Paenibacillus pinistramenti]|uniref:3D domain-containing protein n=1 Tax=Paenibacillus pinistramenti TaxID=1768003 RepID=UPI003B82C75D